MNYVYVIACSYFIMLQGNPTTCNSDQSYPYYISYPLELNWFEAQRFCAYFGTHLVVIESEEEYKKVVTALKFEASNHNVTGIHSWIDATDLGMEGNFYWQTNGAPMLISKWGPGHPTDAQKTKHCVIISYGYDYKWHDWECEKKYHFMCQHKLRKQKYVNSNCLENN